MGRQTHAEMNDQRGRCRQTSGQRRTDRQTYREMLRTDMQTADIYSYTDGRIRRGTDAGRYRDVDGLAGADRRTNEHRQTGKDK